MSVLEALSAMLFLISALSLSAPPVFSSTLILTLLMMVGMVFFIRASAKDRTQTVEFGSEVAEVDLLDQLKDYFDQRAYQVTQVDADSGWITLLGLVRPSLFIAVFVSAMAAVGLLCLGLMTSYTLGWSESQVLGLLLLSPLAGLFYWRKAGRPEEVRFSLKPSAADPYQTQLTVVAHRDEVLQLRSRLPRLQLIEE